MVLAALVVAAAEVEPLVLLGDPLKVPLVVLLPFPLLEYLVARAPPKTYTGTVVSLTCAAALLNKSRVFPLFLLELQRKASVS